MLAAASYLSGEPMLDQQLGQTFDYSTRDDVRFVEVMTPAHAPEWAKDPEKLFNEVQRKENRVNSQMARSLIIALPRELTLEQNIALLREHVQEQFVSKGMCAQIAIHEIPAKDGDNQPHAHVLLTMRGFNADGTWEKNKNREWNGYDAHGKQTGDVMNAWRDAWEKTQNAHLEKAGRDERISMKSYEKQGIDKIPQIHMGPNLAEMERKGVQTDKGNFNRWASYMNHKVEAVKGWFKDFFKANKAQEAVPQPQYSVEDIKAYYAKTEKAHYRVDEPSIEDMKKQARDEQEQKRAREQDERRKAKEREAQRGQGPQAERTDKSQGERQGATAQTGQQATRPEAAQRPRRVASPEDREHYKLMQPFLQNYPWDSRKDMMHFIAVTSRHMHQKKAEVRQDPFQRLAGARDTHRFRAVWQDRPLPTQGRERSRGGRER